MFSTLVFTWFNLSSMIFFFTNITKVNQLTDSDSSQMFFDGEQLSAVKIVSLPDRIYPFGFQFNEFTVMIKIKNKTDCKDN